MKIRISFVTDGGKDMGMGHVMRSMVFASEVCHSNDILFVTSSDASVQSLIKSRGFKVEFVGDRREIGQILEVNQVNVVIIDRVTVDEGLTKGIKESIDARIVIMDSESAANRWADIVVNGLLTKEFKNEHYIDKTTETEYFCGPRYLILKSDFTRYSKNSVADPIDARKFLLIFGGSDPLNLTDKTLRGLVQTQDKPCEIELILGPKFAFDKDIRRTIDKYQAHNRVHLFRNVDNVAELMWRNELIFTSPGLSMFEGLSVGSNVIVSPQNTLQRRVYDYLFQNYNKTPEIYQFFDESFILTQRERKVHEMEIGRGRAEVIKAIIEL